MGSHSSNVKVVSVPASTSSGVDEDGQVMGYIPFVGSTSDTCKNMIMTP